jgi:hypothetical protein
MDGSEAVITNNTIIDNSADYDVGGIFILDASAAITNNVIANNSGYVCGGIMNWYGSLSITNNTIVHNRPNAIYLGPTMWSWDMQSQPILNNIIWQNEIYMSDYALPEEYDIRFNDIQGGWPGQGNIDADPLFADPENCDYHLESQAGRWDASTRSWVKDDLTSPCIDTGNPDSDWKTELWPHGKRINMGAYGGTAQASMSSSTVGNIADLNNDNTVSHADVKMLAERWLHQEALVAEDLDRNGVVSLSDFCILADEWLWQGS